MKVDIDGHWFDTDEVRILLNNGRQLLINSGHVFVLDDDIMADLGNPKMTEIAELP